VVVEDLGGVGRREDVDFEDCWGSRMESDNQLIVCIIDRW